MKGREVKRREEKICSSSLSFSEFSRTFTIQTLVKLLLLPDRNFFSSKLGLVTWGSQVVIIHKWSQFLASLSNEWATQECNFATSRKFLYWALDIADLDQRNDSEWELESESESESLQEWPMPVYLYLPRSD